MTTTTEINAADLAALDMRQVLVVDVRTAVEYTDTRLAAPHAFVPLDALNPDDFAARHGIIADTPVYTLCASGSRARKAVEKFRAAGFSQAFAITGGIPACRDAGFALIGSGTSHTASPQGPISIERQVRIAIGIFVMLSVLLGVWLDTRFFMFTFFVGFGAAFSGISNWCGMALILAKAPWNAGQSCSGGSCPVDGGTTTSPGASCQ